MIISKRADALQPGDVLAPSYARPRSVILFVISGLDVCVATAPLGVAAPPTETFNPSRVVDVVVPDPTPVQARADEMLALLVEIVGNDFDVDLDLGGRVSKLVDDLRPKPPTLEEALTALDALVRDPLMSNLGGGPIENARAILERSRRTGVLS